MTRDKMRLMVTVLFVLAFVVALLACVFYGYNRLARLRNVLETEWANVDVLLRKRADLIPNIIEVVKGYSKHEREVLEAVARARAEGMMSRGERGRKESELSDFVASVFALRESYPDLKASRDFQELQEQLFTIERQIAEKRSNYNDIVKAYNDHVLKFPWSAVAQLTGFGLAELFEFHGTAEAPRTGFESG